MFTSSVRRRLILASVLLVLAGLLLPAMSAVLVAIFVVLARLAAAQTLAVPVPQVPPVPYLIVPAESAAVLETTEAPNAMSVI